MPAAKASISKLPPVDQLRFVVYSSGGQHDNLTVGGVAAWCWENMVEKNTVTVFIMGEDGGSIDGVCTVTLKGGAMKVHTSAVPNPRWVDQLAELVA